MNEQNPYASFDDQLVVANAPATVRGAFLKKVYGFVLAGILVFATTLCIGAIQGGPLEGLVQWSLRFPWWGHTLALMGGFWVVRLTAHKKGVNIAVFFGFTFLMGILIAPMVYLLAGTASGATIIAQAGILTALIFTGLTGYVLVKGADFGFLGGILTVLSFLVIGMLVLSMFTTIVLGTWFSLVGVLLFSGFILYDTSNILHRWPASDPIGAGVELFADVALLFDWLLHLCWGLGND